MLLRAEAVVCTRPAMLDVVGPTGEGVAMEPITLGGVVAALIAKVAERASDGVVEGGESVLRRAVGTLRRRLADSGDTAAVDALQLVERVPDSAASVQALARVFDERASDNDLREALEQVIACARDGGADIDEITQQVRGDKSVQIAGVRHSEIQISYGSAPTPRDRG